MKNLHPFYFHDETPDEVMQQINYAYHNELRVRIWLGSGTSGKAWLEENDVMGTIGKSTGGVPIPLLINNARSLGGPGILTHCIVKIMTTTGSVLYEHPTFNNPADRAVITPVTGDHLSYLGEVQIDGKCVARFKSVQSAQNWIDFMQGKRFTK